MNNAMKVRELLKEIEYFVNAIPFSDSYRVDAIRNTICSWNEHLRSSLKSIFFMTTEELEEIGQCNPIPLKIVANSEFIKISNDNGIEIIIFGDVTKEALMALKNIIDYELLFREGAAS